MATEPRLVRIVFDPELPPGAYRVGGVRIVGTEDDAALGRELRTSEVACRSEAEAASFRELVAESDWMEMADDPNGGDRQ